MNPPLKPYVSVSFIRDVTSSDHWYLVMFFPDQSVVRLRMTEDEARELRMAVSSGEGTVKVSV